MISVNFEGRSGIVLGVANKRSLAWAIAQQMHQAGASLCFTYQNERLRTKMEPLVEGIGGAPLFELDVNDDAQVDQVFAAAAAEMGGRLDFLVHSIAFAPRAELEGDVLDTSREGFRIALEVSAYSLVRTTRAMVPYVPDQGGSVITLTYLASERVVPKYNVMGSAKAALEHSVRQLAAELGPRGIRVNAVAPGWVRTDMTAAALEQVDGLPEPIPLGRVGQVDDVAGPTLFLCSDLARYVTGVVLDVCGGAYLH